MARWIVKEKCVQTAAQFIQREEALTFTAKQTFRPKGG
jgi:hypothetical protein